MCGRGRVGGSTYPVVWVRELLRVAVQGFKIKGFLLVKGDDFGKRSSVILTEHLALAATRIQENKLSHYVRHCRPRLYPQKPLRLA